MLAVARRNPEFRKLWIAQVISQAGDWMSRMAILSLIASLQGTGEAVGVGLLFGLELVTRMLPTALFSPVAGPIADRLPRRALMVGADSCRALVVLGYLLIDEPGELPLLYTLLVLQMGLGIFYNSARSASVPNTVPPEELHEAYALSAATWSTMLALGAAFGGILVSAIGTRGVFITDALTYVASVLILLRVSLPPTPRQPAPLQLLDVLLFRDIRKALQHVRSLGLMPVLAAKAFWGGAGAYLVILSIAGSDTFAHVRNPFGESSGVFERSSAEQAGFAIAMLFCARGVGTGLGPVLARKFFGSCEAALRKQIAWGFQLGALGYLLFSFTQNLYLAMACVAVAHVGGSNLWVSSTTFWQRRVSDSFRGRVFALEFLAMTVSFSIGGLLGGLLYDWTGSVQQTTWITCGLVALPGLVWAVWARNLELRPIGKECPAPHS